MLVQLPRLPLYQIVQRQRVAAPSGIGVCLSLSLVTASIQ